MVIYFTSHNLLPYPGRLNRAAFFVTAIDAIEMTIAPLALVEAQTVAKELRGPAFQRLNRLCGEFSLTEILLIL